MFSPILRPPLILLISQGLDAYWPFRRTFRGIILSSLPASFTVVLRAVLSKTFAESNKSAGRLALANALDQMGVLDDFKSLINNSVTEEMERFIAQTCPKVRMEHQLPVLREWFNNCAKPWMADIFGKGNIPLSQIHSHFILILSDRATRGNFIPQV